jgi:nitrile hydratase beta subunit
VDGIHDLGGMQGFGPVVVEPDEPPFHAPWEARTHALLVAAALAVPVPGGTGRPFIERMGHAEYLTTSYYEHWLSAIEGRLLTAGVVDAAELAAKQAEIAAGAPVPTRSDADAAAFVRILFQPFPVDDPEGPPPRFAVDDDVQVHRMHPEGHTRCPRYVRGARGRVVAVRPAQPLPDLAVQGDTQVEPFYSVAFTPTELWGDDAELGAASVVVDLWESYLEHL